MFDTLRHHRAFVGLALGLLMLAAPACSGGGGGSGGGPPAGGAAAPLPPGTPGAPGAPGGAPGAPGASPYEVGLTPGWATFGLALPQGAATGAVQVGGLPTQTDVKTRWPDGSIRFAVVTAKPDANGLYPIGQAPPPPPGAFAPQVPSAAVRLTIGGTAYEARLPGEPSGDAWLAGPLVHEGRHVVVPARGDGSGHPFLRVIFDARRYADGAATVDVTVENTVDKAGAGPVTYDVAVDVAGRDAFRKTGVRHAHLARWRRKFAVGGEPAQVAPDLRSGFDARALPRYLALVSNGVNLPTGAGFDILGGANLTPYMPEHGGRPELAPYPDWTARYLVHRDPTQRRYVLANGDQAGSWPVHIREPEGGPFAGLGPGRYVSIDERPGFWIDRRGDAGNRPAGQLGGTNLHPDNAHVPSLAYVPYLLTGDRFYLDEMTFWANFVLLETAQERVGNAREGSRGLLRSNEVRGFAWGLRNLVDACAYLPDGDPARAYFADKIANNLAWLDAYADRHDAPLGTLWEDKRPENDFRAPRVWISTWEQNYLAWSIDHANEQGFPGGARHRDRIVRFQLGLFTHHPEFEREFAGQGVIAVGVREGGSTRYYSSFGELFRANFGASSKPTPFAEYYGVDARLMLLIAVRDGLPGALEAHEYLFPRVSGATGLRRRAGWAIARPGEP